MPIEWSLVSPEALARLDLEGLLESVEPRECFAFSQELGRLLRQGDRWTPEESACLDFALQVTLMTLRRDQPYEPYAPMFVWEGRRSAIPADFPRDVLRSIYPWAAALKDAELKARFLDTIWVQAKDFRAAKDAVPAYVASAKRLFDLQHWSRHAERLERAARVSASLGKSGADLLAGTLAEALVIVRRFSGRDPLYLTHRMTQLLLEFRHGDPKELADFARLTAQAAEKAGDFSRAQKYFTLAADCSRVVNRRDDEAAHRRAAAEVLVKEAAAALDQSGRGAMVAATLLSSAVQAMRQVPGGKPRAEELRRQLVDVQERAVTELNRVSTTVDVTQLTQAAVSQVSGESFSEAILAFCQVFAPYCLESLMRQVSEDARAAPLKSMLTTDILNARGRVVAKAPGLEPDALDPILPGLRHRMFARAALHRGLAVKALIGPAREAILHEHVIDQVSILELILHSPWIPDGHHESITRALVAGFYGDMLLAGHLVPIQFEAVIRHLIESTGTQSWILKPDGTQEERPLSALLELPDVEHALGSTEVFELQDLLTDPLGRNRRNEVAHGLLLDGAFFDSDFTYLWWLLLKYLVLNAHLAQNAPKGTTE